MEGLWNQSREILGVLGDFSLSITGISEMVRIDCDMQTVPGFRIAVSPACLTFLNRKHDILHIDIHSKMSDISNYLPNYKIYTGGAN